MVQTAISIVFQFLGGWIGDLIPKNVALFIFTAIQGLGVVFLTLGSDSEVTHVTRLASCTAE